MLLSVLQAPIRNLALAVKAVADQKEEQGAKLILCSYINL